MTDISLMFPGYIWGCSL